MTMQKLEREKKQQEEMNKKYLDDLQSEEQRGNNEQQLRKKLEGALEVSFLNQVLKSFLFQFSLS